MSETKDVLEYYKELNLERSDYILRARKLEFKPIIPNLPKIKDDLKLLESTLSGFVKRFNNWKFNLLKFEESRL
jgi:hypothetical protein